MLLMQQPCVLIETRAAELEVAVMGRRIDAVDLFPNSHHVEAIATLTRVAPGG